MKLVIYPPVEDDRLRKIQTAAGDMTVVSAADETKATAAIVDADAFFGKLLPPTLAAAKHLQWVQTATASLEHYVFPELIQHPCVLTNMRGLFSDVIADHVFGYVLCFARNLHVYIRRQLEAHWEPVGGEEARTNFSSGPGAATAIDKTHMHLADKTLGVLGLGGIGSEVARRGLAFGMTVVAVDPVKTEAPSGVSSLWKPEQLGALLAVSDFVVIAAPHTPATEKLFRKDQFRQMKPTAILINIGRGAIVDLADLTAALEEKLISGAGLDVLEKEPLPTDHPLWSMENVIITPHVAGCSPRVSERHLQVLLENIARFREGKPLVNVANKAEWF